MLQHMPDRATVMMRHVKLFKNGRNPAVRILREFELPWEDAALRKEGNRLVIEPAPPKSLLAVLQTLPVLGEEPGVQQVQTMRYFHGDSLGSMETICIASVLTCTCKLLQEKEIVGLLSKSG